MFQPAGVDQDGRQREDEILEMVLPLREFAVPHRRSRRIALVAQHGGEPVVRFKRRYDLIPNLVETVKGYAGHESAVLENVTRARSNAMSASSSDTGAKISAETELSGAIRSLMIQVEAYPQLKANENFLQLQEELTATENKI